MPRHTHILETPLGIRTGSPHGSDQYRALPQTCCPGADSEHSSLGNVMAVSVSTCSHFTVRHLCLLKAPGMYVMWPVPNPPRPSTEHFPSGAQLEGKGDEWCVLDSGCIGRAASTGGGTGAGSAPKGPPGCWEVAEGS